VLTLHADCSLVTSKPAVVCRIIWFLRNSADVKGGTLKDDGLFHSVWLVEEKKMAHDACETPTVGTNGAPQERR
jgi:hypothetical protein